MRKIILIAFITLIGCNKSIGHGNIQKEKQIFVCPPCGESYDSITYEKEGICPYCDMKLIPKTSLGTKKNANKKDLTICFYLQDNVELLDFAGPMEVFTAAGFKVFTVSKTKDRITSQGVLTIIPEYSIQDAPKSDVMVFFGGSHSTPTNDPAVISWIKSRKKNTDYFISVCTGAFIMGKAGILDNLTATTFHSQIEALQKALPTTKVLPNVRFVDNGNVITTAGISAGIDGALHFVAKIKGEEFAKKIAKIIEYDKWIPEQGLIVNKK
ncbi:DJ-1/PfpI family protein [Flavobacterium soyangense]|uniref:DJ-1/PfpI family protein n=1 Tax=Flavobacterium soyangense TaxID=2023265 RepID=A0A930XZ97_9FLAO|nr:DJ-1/PfpI family protein [Flavobacterium soyangense]MBF2708648.1 DJ-1/PfpI family protein [Flavobacterium soyangense]